MKKYKIYWITLCKNEEDIIPFCIQYWKRIADKVIVFDNHSTDSSVELLSKHDWIEVRTFDSDGQNDVIQKTIKEQSYLEFKDECDAIIISDMDETFYFDNFSGEVAKMIDGGYSCLITPIHSLCEEFKPTPHEKHYLHQLCHMFYKQRMNHMSGFDDFSKISIFNCKVVDRVAMSVGQHYVQTLPNMQIMLSIDGFCLHVDKGFGESYFIKKRQKMGANLSETNKRGGMCTEYLKSVEELKQEYADKQKKSYDLNKKL